MSANRLVVVTASTNPNRALRCLQSWGPVPIVLVLNGPTAMTMTGWEHHLGPLAVVKEKEYLGTVEAFKIGTDLALQNPETEIIACLHDDWLCQDAHWAERTLKCFDQHPDVGLLGYGGAIGLGSEDLYKVPYDPMQLARIGFRSNLVDAEVHGVRSLLAEEVACLDGFSQVGTRDFWLGYGQFTGSEQTSGRPWDILAKLGIKHHFYDGALGCIAKRHHMKVYYLPVYGRHYGGQTAVGDTGYQEWANKQTEGGDHGFWEQAHRKSWEAFKDVLPIRI
jgi:hypothetical protein